MAEEWVTVVNYGLPGTAPKRATKKHFELNLSGKGFELFDPENSKLGKDGKVPAKGGK